MNRLEKTVKNSTNRQITYVFEGNMEYIVDEKVRRIQLCQLEILKEIVRICEKNNIEYWLAFGTMLGAVRHKGFIPWDDDLDVYMTLDGLKQFVKCSKKDLRLEYLLRSPFNDCQHGYLFAKVRKKGTAMTEYNRPVTTLDGREGIWVDIFPLLSLSDDPKKKDQQLEIVKEIQKKRTKHLKIKKGEIFKNSIKIVYELYIRFCETALWSHAIHLGNKDSHNYISLDNLFWPDSDASKREKRIMSKELFKKIARYQFEDGFYNGVSDYDFYLSRIYSANYMIPVVKSHLTDYSNVVL